MARTLVAVWMLAGTALLAGQIGCANQDPSLGYTTTSQYPKDVQSVAVPIFTRAAGEYRRGIEFRLTEAVKKLIPMKTDYRVVDRARADTVLIGRLNSVLQRPLSFNTATGRPREYQVRLSVDLIWRDLRGAGRTRVERKDFRLAAEFIPDRPFQEDFFMGSEDAVNQMAERIVEQLAKPW